MVSDGSDQEDSFVNELSLWSFIIKMQVRIYISSYSDDLNAQNIQTLKHPLLLMERTLQTSVSFIFLGTLSFQIEGNGSKKSQCFQFHDMNFVLCCFPKKD